MTDKLKTCPFCGGKPKFAKSGAAAWVFCSNCGATQDSCKTNKEAVDNWNARATDKVKREPSSYSCRACKSGTDDEIERLKTENARLRGNIEAIKKIVDKPPMSIYDAARIYAECCEALGEKNDA